MLDLARLCYLTSVFPAASHLFCHFKTRVRKKIAYQAETYVDEQTTAGFIKFLAVKDISNVQLEPFFAT